MYRQPSRSERRLNKIEAAAVRGNFSVILSLYSNEYKKLKSMGFILEQPSLPFNDLQQIKVSWDTLHETLFSEDEPIYAYLSLKTDVFPETECFADACFIKALRFHLQNCSDTTFVSALIKMLKNNCYF